MAISNTLAALTEPGTPYALGQLKFPLTNVQYNTIIAYLVHKFPGQGTAKEWAKLYRKNNRGDEEGLISQYELVAFGVDAQGRTPGPGAPLPPGLQPLPNSPLPGGSLPNPIHTFKTMEDAVKAIAHAFESIVSALTSKQFYIRAGEFGVGAILVTVGVKAIFGQTEAYQSAARTVKKTAKVAAL